MKRGLMQVLFPVVIFAVVIWWFDGFMRSHQGTTTSIPAPKEAAK